MEPQKPGDSSENQSINPRLLRQKIARERAAQSPSAVVQGAARQKNGFCEGSARGNWDPREGQQSFRPKPKGVGHRTNTLRRLLIGAVQLCSLYILSVYTTEFSHSTIQKDSSQCMFWGLTEGPY